jgi:pyruvate,orthophosphate dikinase
LERDGGRIAPPSVDILIPFVMVPAELRALKSAILQIASDLCGDRLPPLRFGCMIEIPSLLLCPEEIAALVDFVSFGTNDLVALTYGISRGDSYERYLLEYLQTGILEEDPFLVLPAPIIRQICHFSGRLRAANPGVEIDFCGEQALATDLSSLIRSGALDSVSIGTACLPRFFASLLRNEAGKIV